MARKRDRRSKLATELREEARKLLAWVNHTDNPAVKRGLVRQAFELVQKAEEQRQPTHDLTKILPLSHETGRVQTAMGRRVNCR